MATYAEELESFKQQWNLPDYSLDGVANSVQQLRYTDTFLMGTSPDNSPGSQFVKWLSRLLPDLDIHSRAVFISQVQVLLMRPLPSISISDLSEQMQ